MKLKTTMLSATLTATLSSMLVAQHASFGPNENSGVQNRRGNTSPTQGFTAGEGNSRIDDYFNQDEQININPDSGVIKVLRVNQKNLINDFVSATFPVANIFATEMRNMMRTVTAMEGGRAEVIRDNQKGEAFIEVIAPKFMLPWIEAAIADLDEDWVSTARDGSAVGRYFSKYRPSETLDDIASRYAGDGATQFDPNMNYVQRRDEPYRVAEYLKACEQYDTPPPQALLRFKIYEVDTSNDLKLGVDWIAWKNGPGRSLFEAIFAGQESHQRFENATGQFDPNLGAFTAFNNGSNSYHNEATQYLLSANYVLTSAYLDFLRVKGKSRVLAQPEIFAFTHRTGIWRSTDEFLSFETTPDDPGAFGLVPSRLNTVDANQDRVARFSNFRPPPDFSVHNRLLNHNRGGELGMTLQVFSAVGTESTETEIEFTSTDLAGTTPQGTPILTTRRIETKLRLIDGQPFVFGGLTREEDIKTSNKAPWLGDIPILGYLFGQETSSARRKEIVISVVPHFFQGAPTEVTEPLMVDTMQMAAGDQRIEPPDNSFGFDMWLFDTVEHP